MSLAGKLEELPLPDILQLLSLAEKSGRLSLTSRDAEGLLVFRRGRIIYAASNSARESFGNILVCRKLVDEPTLRKALERQHRSREERRLGQILIEMGALSQEALEQAMFEQVENVVGGLFAWREGYFKFEALDIADRGEVEVDAREFLLDSGISGDKVAIDLSRQSDEADNASRATTAAGASVGPRVRRPTDGPGRVDVTEATLGSMVGRLGELSLTAEVTGEVLRLAAEVLARGVLLLVERDGVIGLAQFGLSDERGSADERVRELWLPLDEASVVADVVASRRSHHGPLPATDFNERLVAELEGGWPKEAAVLPLVAGDRVVAVLYGDNLSTGRPLAGLEPLERQLAEFGKSISTAASARRARGPA